VFLGANWWPSATVLGSGQLRMLVAWVELGGGGGLNFDHVSFRSGTRLEGSVVVLGNGAHVPALARRIWVRSNVAVAGTGRSCGSWSPKLDRFEVCRAVFQNAQQEDEIGVLSIRWCIPTTP
jgi:hypothetical protein